MGIVQKKWIWIGIALALNDVNNATLPLLNMTLDDVRSQWPLKTRFENNQLFVLLYLNNENLTMHDDGSGNLSYYYCITLKL